MKILVNGQPQVVEEKINIGQLLKNLNLNQQQVVIELNRKILNLEDIPTTLLNADDQLEIIHFVGGG